MLDSTAYVCTVDTECLLGNMIQNEFPHHVGFNYLKKYLICTGCKFTILYLSFCSLFQEEFTQASENAIMDGIQLDSNYWITLTYLSVTAIATIIFFLGYYSIEVCNVFVIKYS